MRKSKEFKLINPRVFKKQLLLWCSKNNVFAFHDTNGFNLKQSKVSQFPDFEILAATGIIDIFESNYGKAFHRLDEFLQKEKDWYFGIFGYDLKNELENLVSENKNFTGFKDMLFFRPELVFRIRNSTLEIFYFKERLSNSEIDDIYSEIQATNYLLEPDMFIPEIKQRISKEDYLSNIRSIKEHISRGDIFEMNFCIEFFSEDATIHPALVFTSLMEQSPSPYACMYRFENCYLISSSPERFLAKNERNIISQPMKGTIRRDSSDIHDEVQIEKLKKDPKEVSENIMIVDLVRNDLAKTAVNHSVKVEELCGIYSYATVHQMVSTVHSKLSDEFDALDVIKTCFPMGSMTGAPKVKAMQLIDRFEETKRGVYSGASGYFTPLGDFDFNVIIRSILYNKLNRYLSFSTGGAITSNSVPELEYEECLLKAEALKKALISYTYQYDKTI